MGNNIESNRHTIKYSPQNIMKKWMGFCASFMDPILSMTLWQGGPPPWVFGAGNMNFSNNSVWNMAFPWTGGAGIGDSFVQSSSSSSTTKTQEEKDKEEFKKEQLGKKIDKLKKILNEYKATLNKDVESEYLVIKEIERTVNTSGATQENYDKLVKIFKENNIGDKLKTDVLESMLSSEDRSFRKKISNDCWTKKNWSSKVNVTEDNVLEYIATFNEISKGKLVATLLNRTLDKDPTTKKNTNDRDKIVEHLEDIQNSLIKVAQDICDGSFISDETKENLGQAIDKLKNSSPDAALCKANYQDYQEKLANLFNLTRKAKIESFEKEHEHLELTFSEDEKKKLEDSKM